MIELRTYEGLGRSDLGWLKARHHFSIGSYFAPDRMGWGSIRVWNDDEFAPGGGFPLHPHSDMEIITYVRQGAITHEDSLGNRGRTIAGDVQVMSAGTGIRHSEFNFEAETTSLFQIWILPEKRGVPPRWDTKPFPKADRAGKLVTLASGFLGDEGALPISAAARVLGATLAPGQSVHLPLEAKSHAYLVPLNGSVVINDIAAKPGDGVAITDEQDVRITAQEDAEIVIVETS